MANSIRCREPVPSCPHAIVLTLAAVIGCGDDPADHGASGTSAATQSSLESGSDGDASGPGPTTGASAATGESGGGSTETEGTASESTGDPNEVTPDGFYQLERLDRGVVAVSTAGGVYIGWRLFGYDPDGIAFNLYRDGQAINTAPLTETTDFVDPEGTLDSIYHVTSIVDGVEGPASPTASVWPQPYLEIPLDTPAPVADATYTSNDGSVGDLDGDGNYELVIKWEPSNAHDNSQAGRTGNVYVDAYALDGTRLWRIDLGVNIRAGAHYTQFLVYDLDGDGRAEVAMKTAPGTIDGAGEPVLLEGDDPNADYRNADGYVLQGPEYFTIFDGQTGAALATAPFLVPRGNVSAWGDNYGNRVDRFLATVAFVDDTGRPSAIMARGYYTRATLTAWNWRDGQLTPIWTADSDQDTAYAGQGAHSLSVANVDDDLPQEILYGASTVDHDGTAMCSTGFGHGDALHASDFITDRPGVEVFMPHESGSAPAASLRDGATCEVLWRTSDSGGSEGPGRGVAADVDARNEGAEAWVNNSSLWDMSDSLGATSTNAMTNAGQRPGSTNFVISWDADHARELLDGTSIGNADGNGVGLQAQGCSANNGTKSTPTLSADLLGDYREEVIFRCGESVRLYTTTDPAIDRIYTLMHDPQYRVAISWQNVGYNQPPHPSFYLGEGMAPPPRPDIHVP